jgi:hypothetical protein
VGSAGAVILVTPNGQRQVKHPFIPNARKGDYAKAEKSKDWMFSLLPREDKEIKLIDILGTI